MKLVGTRKPGENPAMRLGWPGVLSEPFTTEEKKASENEWDLRVSEGLARTGRA